MNITDKIVLTILLLLGLLTLFLSSSIIFDLFEIREMEGNYFGFVVWANFISAILYIITALDFILRKKWNWRYLGVSFVVLLIATISFWVYVANGGIHEVKTIKAIIFRLTFTGILLSIIFIKYKKGLKK